MCKIDIRVNNAGIVSITPFVLGKVEEWERTMDFNIDPFRRCAWPLF